MTEDGNKKTRHANGLRVGTRCESVDEFVEKFHRFCEDGAVFVPHANRQLGVDCAFSFDLVNGQSALCGLGTVLDHFETANNRFRRPGIVIGITRLQADSRRVFENMLATRALKTRASSSSGVPEPVAAAPSVNIDMGRATPVPVRMARAVTSAIEVIDSGAIRRNTVPMAVISIPKTASTPRPGEAPAKLASSSSAMAPADGSGSRIPGSAPDASANQRLPAIAPAPSQKQLSTIAPPEGSAKQFSTLTPPEGFKKTSMGMPAVKVPTKLSLVGSSPAVGASRNGGLASSASSASSSSAAAEATKPKLANSSSAAAEAAKPKLANSSSAMAPAGERADATPSKALAGPSGSADANASSLPANDKPKLGPSSFAPANDKPKLGPSSFAPANDKPKLGPSSFAPANDKPKLGPSPVASSSLPANDKLMLASLPSLNDKSKPDTSSSPLANDKASSSPANANKLANAPDDNATLAASSPQLADDKAKLATTPDDWDDPSDVAPDAALSTGAADTSDRSAPSSSPSLSLSPSTEPAESWDGSASANEPMDAWEEPPDPPPDPMETWYDEPSSSPAEPSDSVSGLATAAPSAPEPAMLGGGAPIETTAAAQPPIEMPLLAPSQDAQAADPQAALRRPLALAIDTVRRHRRVAAVVGAVVVLALVALLWPRSSGTSKKVEPAPTVPLATETPPLGSATEPTPEPPPPIATKRPPVKKPLATKQVAKKPVVKKPVVKPAPVKPPVVKKPPVKKRKTGCSSLDCL